LSLIRLEGERERGFLGVSLGFQIGHFTVAVLRENFGALRGRTGFLNVLQSYRGYSDLVARQIS